MSCGKRGTLDPASAEHFRRRHGPSTRRGAPRVTGRIRRSTSHLPRRAFDRHKPSARKDGPMPAGRPAKVDHVREAFLREVDQAISLVDAIGAIPAKVRPSNNVGLHPKHAGQVAGLAFMGLVASWEEFLERTLVRYLTGAKTDSGYSPTLRAGRAPTIENAYKLLSLDPEYKPEKSFLKVTDTRWVRMVADFYFSRHPYGVLQNQTGLLKHASKIRNRIAHGSTKCKTEFKDTAIYFLRPPNNRLKQGFGPAALLQSPVQRHFGQQAVNAQTSHLAAYADFFRSMARSIVP